ncbi:MAG: hypothetical protein FWC01_10020, partial [Treponema sp.]|nr:hypothetical protein [Treponema sp.]
CEICGNSAKNSKNLHTQKYTVFLIFYQAIFTFFLIFFVTCFCVQAGQGAPARVENNFGIPRHAQVCTAQRCC